MHDTFDSDGIVSNAKENKVLAHSNQSSFWSNLRTKLVEVGMLGYLFHPSAQHSHPTGSVAWTVPRNVLRNLFQIASYARREEQPHLFAACLRKGIVFTLQPIKERA
jgi:hypothetical protein